MSHATPVVALATAVTTGLVLLGEVVSTDSSAFWVAVVGALAIVQTVLTRYWANKDAEKLKLSTEAAAAKVAIQVETVASKVETAAVKQETVAAKVETVASKAQQAADKVERVAERLETSDHANRASIQQIKETGQANHMLLNSARGVLLKELAFIKEQLAQRTGSPEDASAAQAARAISEDHEAKQTIVDEEKKRGAS